MSKTSVPSQWNRLFSERNDGNLHQICDLGIKAFLLFYRADIVHAYHIKSGFIFIVLSKIFRKKTVFTLVGSIKVASPLNAVLFNIIAILSNKLVVVSPSLITGIATLKMYNQFKYKIQVIQNGVDLNIDKIENDSILDKYNINKSAKIIFHPARFVIEKNHIKLLKALKIVVKKSPKLILLVLSGDGKLYKSITNEIANYKLEKHVILTGLIPRVDVLSLLDKCNLFVMPSVSEGLNISFLEALTKRKKILVSNIPSFSSFFTSNSVLPKNLNTKIVDPYDINDIAKGILEQMSNNKINDFDRSIIDANKMIDSYTLLYKQL